MAVQSGSIRIRPTLTIPRHTGIMFYLHRHISTSPGAPPKSCPAWTRRLRATAALLPIVRASHSSVPSTSQHPLPRKPLRRLLPLARMCSRPLSGMGHRSASERAGCIRCSGQFRRSFRQLGVSHFRRARQYRSAECNATKAGPTLGDPGRRDADAGRRPNSTSSAPGQSVISSRDQRAAARAIGVTAIARNCLAPADAGLSRAAIDLPAKGPIVARR